MQTARRAGESDRPRGDGVDKKDRENGREMATPWVSAEELQPLQRPQSSAPLDDVDEALMESFPCSDPPCFSHAHV